MKMSMLEYCKVILEKVHFDQKLFHKEYGKSLRWLSHEEGKHLHKWLTEKFGPLSIPFYPQHEKIHPSFSSNMARHEYAT